ncbi:MAG: hypothetical protein GEV09_11955 [Pseudonocardiaceae bacterium]|nr:hypothetical protein [Pseudonocardiaceae bacterium]
MSPWSCTVRAGWPPARAGAASLLAAAMMMVVPNGARDRRVRGRRTGLRAAVWCVLAALLMLGWFPAAASGAPPALTVSAPTAGATLPFGQPVELAGDGKRPGHRIEISEGGSELWCAFGPPADDAAGVWMCTIDELLDPGRHVFDIVQRNIDDPSDVSPAVTRSVTIADSLLSVTSPDTFETGSPIVITGNRDTGSRFRVRARLTRSSDSSFDEGLRCDSSPPSGDTFTCTLPADRVPPTGTDYVLTITEVRDGEVFATSITVPLTIRDPSSAPDPTPPPSTVSPPGAPPPDAGPPPPDPGSPPDAGPPGPDPRPEAGPPPAPAASPGPNSPPESSSAGAGNPPGASPTGPDTPSPAPGPSADPGSPSSAGTRDQGPAVALPSSGQPVLDPVTDSETVGRRVLLLAVSSLAILGIIGPGGLGSSSRLLVPAGGIRDKGDTRRAYLRAGTGWGDRSWSWRTPGWQVSDRYSHLVPMAIAARMPLASRSAGDAIALRAISGVAWILWPVTGLTMGIAAAVSGAGSALPPQLALVITIALIGIFDASAGAAATIGFIAVVLARGGLTAEGLSVADGARSLLGLSILWFVIPVLASVARPYRRMVEDDRAYWWDRFGDSVIASLVGGWAAFSVARAMGYLTGRDLDITSHAAALGLIVIGALLARFALEELTVWAYPARVRAVLHPGLPPEPTRLHDLRGVAARTVLVALVAVAFTGNCWQLWVGLALYATPQVVAFARDRIPQSPRISRLLPRGVLLVFLLISWGLIVAAFLVAATDDVTTRLQFGFLLYTLALFVHKSLLLFGREAPWRPWSTRRELAGALLVIASTILVIASA